MFNKKEATRIGEILVNKGLITPEQLAIATQEQIKRNRLLDATDPNSPKGVMIGEILVEFGFIDQLDLKRGLNWQQRLRHVSIAMALCAPFMAFTPIGASAASVSSSSSSSSTSKNFSPVIIQAENYTTMSGVWNETTTDVGGGQNTGNINTGDWMSYTNTPVNIPVSGTYKITYRVASLNTAGSMALKEASSGAILDTVPMPVTGGWQKWVDVTRTVTLTQGNHAFKLEALIGGYNLNWFKIEFIAAAASSAPVAISSSSSSKVSSSAASLSSAKPASVASSAASSQAALANKQTLTANATTSASSAASSSAQQWIIQAENYTTMSGVWNETTTDVGGGLDTGNINSGDWMSYSNTKIDIPVTGDYKVTFRIASLNTAGTLAFREASTEATLDTVPIPVTGGWQTWVDVTRTVKLTQGTHSFKLFAVVGGFNVNWFKIEPAAGTLSTAQTSSTSSKSVSSISSLAALSSSSKSSAPATVASSSSSSLPTIVSSLVKGPVGLSWVAPNQRENGNFLDITELAGYELRYKLRTADQYIYITIKDPWTNQYNFPWLEGDYVFQIAAFDKNGIYSNFTNLQTK